MVRQEIIRVRRLLTVQLVLIAFLTAALVAAGSGSLFMPLLVMVVGISSLLFVDWFEWFALHHIAAYFGMIIGTVIALADYFPQAGGDSSRQLASIASLLIYPELVIMMQRKNLRLFEQMAIFLLLELIVAALINDNVLFGVLFAPIVLLWVAALMLFTRYASLIQLAPDMDQPTPRVFELVLEALRRARDRHRTPPPKMLDVVQPQESRQATSSRSGLFVQAYQIGFISLLSACLYFYILPRTTIDLTPLGMTPRTGLSETMTLGSMQKILQDKTPVMRVSLRDAKTGKPYSLVEPPYIRSMVLSRYLRNSTNATTMSSFESSEQPAMQVRDSYIPLRVLKPQTKLDGDSVLVNFDIISSDGSMLPCIAPMTGLDRQRNYISVLPFEWRMINNRSDQYPRRTSMGYMLLTTAFRQGEERPVLPDSRVIFNHPPRNVNANLLTTLSRVQTNRGEYYSTQWIATLLDKVRVRSPHAQTPIEIAQAVESFLSKSGEYTYSLAGRVPAHTDMDPIEDFVVNQKRGHCQYFAATLTMVLRYLHIPSRIVLGYHPLEYNELGQYFSVRRSDAHAWVEAYFDAESLKAAGLYSNDCGEQGGWLRLDPTPAGSGSNAGTAIRTQADQGMDFVNKFWNDYVLNGRQRAEDNSLYRPLQDSTRETWKSMMDASTEFIEQARENPILGSMLQRKHWFAWQITAIILVTGIALLLLWRLIRWLPKLAPQLAKKLGLGQSSDDISQHFFKQCLRLLHKAGFTRRSSDTAAEYTQAAGQTLAEQNRWPMAPENLEMLTQAYYQVRFGGNRLLSPETQQSIVKTLGEMEKKLT